MPVKNRRYVRSLSGIPHAMMKTQVDMFARFLLMPTDLLGKEFENYRAPLKTSSRPRVCHAGETCPGM